MQKGLVFDEQTERRYLSPDEKAAVLLLALGPDYGKPILEELDELEIRQLSRAMVKLGPITQDMLDELMAEFVTTMSSNGSISGNSDTTERLLLSFLPQDRVESIMEEIRGPAGRNMWEKLSNVQEDVLANYLKNEYPQTIAVVLSKIVDRPCQPGAGGAARGTGAWMSCSACWGSTRCKRKSSKRSRRRCAPSSCRRSATPSAATATSRWPKSSIPSTGRPRRAS